MKPWQRHGLAAASATVIFLLLFFVLPFAGILRTFVAAVTAVSVGGALAALPQIEKNSRRGRIDDSLPFFITHFGVLATTSLPLREILRALGENQEYPEVAAEARRILRLVTDWGLSLSDAVRSVAEATPSKVFSRFLVRMAHAIESGQILEKFLEDEQAVVLQEYASVYQARLLKVDSWKEMYTSSIMTLAFLAVFVGIMPLLVGGSTALMTMGVAAVSIVMEILLGVLLRDRLPSDRFRPRRTVQTFAERRLRWTMMGAAGAGILTFLIALFSAGLPLALLLASIPFATPGILAIFEEAAIRRREGDFPAFIRSVGAATAARGGSVRDVLEHVQTNKLGSLASPVRDLHRRLAWRIDDRASWRRFGAETGSRLIDAFTDMLVEGIRSGGKPGPISQIISNNMMRILALRTTRRATAGAFRGILFGLSAGLSLVLFTGSGIFDHLMATLGENAAVLEAQGLFSLQVAGATAVAQGSLFVFVALHGAAGGVYYKFVEGGRMEGAAFYGALFTALGVGVGMAVLKGLPTLLG